MIKLYNQLLQEMTARFSNVRKSEEPNGLLGRTTRTKEEENDLLMVKKKKNLSFYVYKNKNINHFFFYLEANS
jgi:hypothetical protein